MMLFEINLLKDRERQRKRKSFLRTILYVELSLFVLTFILLGSYRFALDYKVDVAQRELTMLNEDIIFLSREGTTLENLRDINKKYAGITSQLSTINEFAKNRIIFSHKLKGLSAVIPDNVWISRLNIEEESVQKKGKKDSEQAKILYLSGFVMAEREDAFVIVQSFIKELENEPLFVGNIESIKLSSISKPQSKFSENVMEFKITCQILKR